MDKSYSYSMLSAAYRCNRYFKLLYLDNLKPKVDKKNADLFFGSALHYALEEYLIHHQDIHLSFRSYWDSEADNLKYGRYNRKSLENTAMVLLQRFVKRYAKKVVPHMGEVRLHGKIGDVRIEGTPDLCGLFDGKESILDFKTSAYRYPKEKISINEQMYMYAELAKQNGYNATQVVYIVFIKGYKPGIQILKKELTETHRKLILDNIVVQCQNLDRMQLDNTWSYNSNSCIQGDRKCDFFDKCWKGKI